MIQTATTTYASIFKAATGRAAPALGRGNLASPGQVRQRAEIRRITNPELRDHLLRLSPADRYLRFGHCMTDDNICVYATQAAVTASLIFGLVVNSEARGIGELRSSSESSSRLELGLSVEAQWRGQGYGTDLVEHALAAASASRTDAVFALINCSNRDMRTIAGKLGAAFTERHGEIHAEWALSPVAVV